MKKALCKNLNDIKVVDCELPEISDDEILLRVHLCGICGSDVKKLNGPGLKTAQTLGHEVVGHIERLGSNLKNFSQGDRLVVAHHVPCFDCHFCRHENFSMCRTFKKTNLDPGGFAQFLRIPATHVHHTAFKVVEGIPDEAAIYMEPLACCVRAFKRARLQKKDRALIVGFGSIGILFALMLKTFEVEVAVVDLDDARLEIAKKLGFLPLHPKLNHVPKEISTFSRNLGVDAVIFTAGRPENLQESFAWLRDGGTALLFSELSHVEMAKVSTEDIYRRELTVISSYSPGIQDLKDATELINASKIDLSALKPKAFALTEISKAISQMTTHRILKGAINPWVE